MNLKNVNCSILKKKKKLLSLEDKYMLDCLNELDDEETNVDKIAKVTYEFLMFSSLKDAKKVIEECQADGKTH